MADKKDSEHTTEGIFADEGPLQGIVKKLIVGGVSTIFVTQEKAKELLGELKLPKEILEMILSNANKTKSEFFKGLAEELSKSISTVDILEEGKKFLTENKVKLKIDLEFEPKKSGDTDK